MRVAEKGPPYKSGRGPRRDLHQGRLGLRPPASGPGEKLSAVPSLLSPGLSSGSRSSLSGDWPSVVRKGDV